METVPIGAIKAETTTQARVSINMEVVEEYAEAIKGGAKFPPMVLFSDGKTHWLADGFHRLQAYKQLGYRATECQVHRGTAEDAILHAVSANDRHGLRRTNEDKRRSVQLLLSISAWLEKSANEIAQQCGVSRTLAESVKNSVENQEDPQDAKKASSIGKDGKRYPRRKKTTQAKKGTRAKDQDKKTLDALKAAFKTLNKAPMDGATIADKFGRKKLGPNLDGAVAFMNELCAAFEIQRVELTGVTDIPENLNREAWAQWVAYRKEAKLKTYTPTSAKKQMEALAQNAKDRQQEIVDASIRNQYQGLFPAKDVGHGKSGQGNGAGTSKRERSEQKLKEWAEQRGVDTADI